MTPRARSVVLLSIRSRRASSSLSRLKRRIRREASKGQNRAWIGSVQGAVATWSVIIARYCHG